VIGVPTLARCGAAALLSAALAQLTSPGFGLGLALLVAPLLARVAPPAHLAAVAIAVRAFLPDASVSLDVPAVRERLAWPIATSIPEPEASIAVGALLGGKADLARSLRDAFARTGTTHLLAASGFNITLVAGALGAALRPLGRRAVAAGTIVAALAMAVAAGFAPSIVRAALMSLAASIAVFVGRPSTGFGALGAAVLLLLFLSPRTVTDVGFLLSISATAGLLVLSAPLERSVPGPAWLRGQLATTGAATLASLPISAEVFGRISLVSPLANLAAAPLVPPLMGATGVAVAFGAIAQPLALVPAWIAYGVARALRAVVETASAFPAASVSFPHAGAAVVATYLAGLAVVRLPRLRRYLVAAAFVGALAVTGASIVGGAARERIVALDVGQGDAFLLEAADARVLIDAGPDPARTVRALAAALPAGVTQLEVVALTHSHADHEAGFAAVLDRYQVGLALEPAGLEMNVAAAEWRDALARHQVAVRSLTRGDRIRIGAIVLEALAPLGDPMDPLPNLVLRADVGALSGVFLGDASERGQEDLLLHGSELRADVYAPPHHGAATPHAAALVAAARPSVALISVGAGNRYGHPTPQTLRALANVPTLRTDRDGTLEVVRDGNIFRCATRSSALSRAWNGWLSRPPPCA
jgi:competence protein ComEC